MTPTTPMGSCLVSAAGRLPLSSRRKCSSGKSRTSEEGSALSPTQDCTSSRLCQCAEKLSGGEERRISVSAEQYSSDSDRVLEQRRSSIARRRTTRSVWTPAEGGAGLEAGLVLSTESRITSPRLSQSGRSSYPPSSLSDLFT